MFLSFLKIFMNLLRKLDHTRLFILSALNTHFLHAIQCRVRNICRLILVSIEICVPCIHWNDHQWVASSVFSTVCCSLDMQYQYIEEQLFIVDSPPFDFTFNDKSFLIRMMGKFFINESSVPCAVFFLPLWFPVLTRNSSERQIQTNVVTNIAWQ